MQHSNFPARLVLPARPQFLLPPLLSASIEAWSNASYVYGGRKRYSRLPRSPSTGLGPDKRLQRHLGICPRRRYRRGASNDNGAVIFQLSWRRFSQGLSRREWPRKVPSRERVAEWVTVTFHEARLFRRGFIMRAKVG